jgi:hypothetical protein
MNSQIDAIKSHVLQELAQEALSNDSSIDLEKFAKLIIRSCIDSIDLDYSSYNNSHDDLIELRAHQTARKMIMDHFELISYKSLIKL